VIPYIGINSYLDDKLQTNNKINGAMRRHFGIQLNKETKLRIHIITALMHVKFTYVFLLDRNFEILIFVKPGRDRSVTTATVSSTNQVEPGSHLIRSLYL